jgi:hypothetical protein
VMSLPLERLTWAELGGKVRTYWRSACYNA